MQIEMNFNPIDFRSRLTLQRDHTLIVVRDASSLEPNRI